MAKTRQNSSRQVDRIKPADLQIFKLAQTNANFFTDHYLRSPTSGTYWKKNPNPPDDDKAAAWEVMNFYWRKANMPHDVFEYAGIVYKILWDDDNYPVFWHHHGILLQPWQLHAHHAIQQELTVIGGYGSGKTLYEAIDHVVRASTTPYYRGYAIAPKMIQAVEVYRYICSQCAGTPFWDRWVWAYPQKPYPKIVIKNNYIGESTIEILSLEHDLEKVLTLEANNITVDQGEKFTELDDLVEKLGSRLRGQINGQPRLPGRLTIVANSDDNPELWYRFDMGEYEPKTFLSLHPSSEDNPYLSKQDIENMKRRVGGEKADIEQHMHAARPIGSGEHFNSAMIKLCLDEGLDHIMDDNLLLETPGFIKRTKPRVGTYHWEMPPIKGRAYVVIADPGQGNPPDRNSAIIMVWDVTDFPQRPAILRAFNWVFCHGSYWPFLTAYEDYVQRYRAQGRNAFDSTGTQKGFDELVFSTMGLAAEGLNLAVSGKMHSLNAAKFFMGRGMMSFPYIEHLNNQLSNYRLPDNKIRQDLVMCLAMSALYIRRYYYEDIPDIDERVRSTVRAVDRYSRSSGDRWSRSSR